MAPAQVVDVLALMGDSIDNVKGVPGHRREGRARSDRDAWLARRAADTPRRRCRRRSTVKRCWRTRTTRDRAGSWCRIRTDVPVDVRHRTFRYTGPVARAVLRAVLGARLPNARDGVRADGRHGRSRITPLIESIEELDALSREMRGAGRVALRVLADRLLRCARAIVGHGASPMAPRRARYLPLGHRDARFGGPVRSSGQRSSALKPLFEDPERSGKSATTSSSISSCSRATASTLRGPRARHDAGELSARRHAIVAPARGRRRSSIWATRR